MTKAQRHNTITDLYGNPALGKLQDTFDTEVVEVSKWDNLDHTDRDPNPDDLPF